MRKNFPSVTRALIILTSFVFASFSMADDPFLNKASQANLAEIQAGKLAEAKGSATIKRLGKQMAKDHTMAQDELTALAKKQNLDITLHPDAAHQQALEEMSKLSGKAFDDAYIKTQLADHQAIVALFSDEASNGPDPGLKTYAGEYLPKLKMHLQMFMGDSSAMKMTMDSGGLK